MEYHNPDIPEGINTTNEHPLKEFSILLGGLVLLVILLVVVLSVFANTFARYIPFEIEAQLASSHTQASEEFALQNQYLQELSDKLSAVMDLTGDMTITAHYLDSDTVNAFATLGGNIFIFKGLMNKVPDENTLAMVVAHEIAHIKHRDPVASASRGLILALVLSVVTGGMDTSFIVDKSAMLTALKFNRDMEAAADDEALLALQKLYGHAGGAQTLFELFIEEHDKIDKTRLPQIFLTHPLEEARIENIQTFALENPAADNTRTSLPEAIVIALQNNAD